MIVFGEGATEERLVRCLLPHAAPGWRADFRTSGGKGSLAATIRNSLGEKLSQPALQSPVHCVIMADQDAGETTQRIQQRHADGLRRLLDERGYPSDQVVFRPVADHDNVSLFTQLLPPGLELCVALHIARRPASLQALDLAPGASTDDYVLAVALADPVVQRFADEAGLPAPALTEKVKVEIPQLLRANGVADLEAKDLIGIYMAVSRFLKVKRTEGKERFADIAAQRALKDAQPEFDAIFASLIAAIRAAIALEDIR
jgi:hypothetical protein